MKIYIIPIIILVLINIFFFMYSLRKKKSLGNHGKTFASTDILVEVKVNQYYFETDFFLTNFLTSQQVSSTAS